MLRKPLVGFFSSALPVPPVSFLVSSPFAVHSARKAAGIGQREARERRERGWKKGKNESHVQSETKVKNKKRRTYHTVYTIYIYIYRGRGGRKNEKRDVAAIGREFHSSANQEGVAGHDQLFVRRGGGEKKKRCKKSPLQSLSWPK